MGLSDKYCFCTLALGEKYCNLAKQLAEDLSQFSPDVPLLVLTDTPACFENVKNTIVIKHSQKSVLGYNDKLCVVKKALELFSTCIFLDADVRVLEPVTLSQEIFQLGLKAYRIRSWEWTKNVTPSEELQRWQREDLRIMSVLRKKLNLQQDDRDIPFIVEFLFAVTRHEKIASFFQKWNELAELCERERFFVHEGFSIGLAAFLTRIPISQNSFEGLNFFEPLISRQTQLADGSMSQAVYDMLFSSIHIYKSSQKKYKWSRKIDRLKRKMTVGLRFCKIRLFGLNLLE